MAYDDDSDGKLGFREFEDLAAIFERYASAPENISISRLLQLVQAVHRISAGRPLGQVDTKELARGLRERGLGTIPFETVVRVAEHVSHMGLQEDGLARFTLRDVQRIIAR